MKTEHALRYLLLRHLRILASAGAPELSEVTQSLRVVPEGRSHRVSWTRAGIEHQRSFPPDAFQFYVRGDTRPQDRGYQDDLDNSNDERASAVAAEMLGLSSVPRPSPATRESVEPFWWWGAGELASFAAVLFVFGGHSPLAASALLAFSLGEFAVRGRLVASVLSVGLASLAPAAAGMVLALVYGAFQWFDSDPRWRTARVVACSTGALIAGARLLADETLDMSWLGLLWCGPWAAGVFGVRWLYGVHFRAVPLALPFYCVGLQLGGSGSAAALGLALLSVATIGRLGLHHLWPVQRERTLTPNG